MYRSTEQALYRAFNVAELFYQKAPLCDLYRAPDWENPPIHTADIMTPSERIEQDCQTYRFLKDNLSSSDFTLLRVMYCRSLDVQEWRESINILEPQIIQHLGRIAFRPQLYEYVCVSHLTGQKIKQLKFTSSTVNRNRKKICQALDRISDQAHFQAKCFLVDRDMVAV